MAQNEATKVAILVCGINGAGKSTYINGVIRPALDQQGMEYVYINADDWQKKQFASFQNETDEHAKAAQVWANTKRDRCIREGQSFVTETVFSHPSKLEVIEEAQSAGLQVHLFHIHVDNADTVLHRINNRIKEGGHSVPADKVLSRYQRILPIIKEAALKADRAYLLDNRRAEMVELVINQVGLRFGLLLVFGRDFQQRIGFGVVAVRLGGRPNIFTSWRSNTFN